MKKEFRECPPTIDQKELYGFSWMEYVAAIPSPLIVVTTYKENGKENATLQSWSTFVGEGGFYCIFGSVYKNGHMYRSLVDTKECVVNFPSLDIYKKCLATVKNNGYDNDEITLSGLTSEDSTTVKAPRIKECFLNLECEYLWKKDLEPGSDFATICVKIKNIAMDEKYYDENIQGRYGKSGFLYNIHSPRNPETGEKSVTYIGTIEKTVKEEDL